jgi:N-carbamoylputrescine amidase
VPFESENCRIGVQLCTEMWSFEMSRRLGMLNSDVIAVPRSTPASSRQRWIAGGRAAAISAGAFCVSSNRAGPGLCDDFAGAGWIIDPDGEVIAVTSRNCPVVTCELNLDAARSAKGSYPRYALNRPESSEVGCAKRNLPDADPIQTNDPSWTRRRPAD